MAYCLAGMDVRPSVAVSGCNVSAVNLIHSLNLLKQTATRPFCEAHTISAHRTEIYQATATESWVQNTELRPVLVHSLRTEVVEATLGHSSSYGTQLVINDKRFYSQGLEQLACTTTNRKFRH